MRRSIIVLAAVTGLVAYVRRQPSSEPGVAETARAATAGLRVIGPIHALISPTLVTTPPSFVEPSPRVLDLIDPDRDPPLPAAPPRAVHGRLVDLDGENAVGAMVAVASPSLQGEQVVLTDEDGYFRIVDLPIGEYVMTVYYNNRVYSRAALDVNDREATAVEDVLDPSDAIVPDPPAPATAVVDDSVNIPVGRTFGAVIGVTEGSQVDNAGTSLVGVTTIENHYVTAETIEDHGGM